MSNFVLASKSPRRRALLAAVGLEPRIIPADIDERKLPHELPIPYALRVASHKAIASDPGELSVVLGADTIVALDGETLGKADDEQHAEEMLLRLAGRTHVVHTAIALRWRRPGRDEMLSDVVSTEVRFRAFSQEEARRYIKTGDPMDKAGAYGIQGDGGALVAEIRGSYTNVVGLPLEETLRLLRMTGVVA
ncbi:MAG: septum formation inhibitor Maf [Deltaproteobacteria bacterium]|nr:septum formation inhibitor Maf [Deltaproteobacteria bacterium]